MHAAGGDASTSQSAAGLLPGRGAIPRQACRRVFGDGSATVLTWRGWRCDGGPGTWAGIFRGALLPFCDEKLSVSFDREAQMVLIFCLKQIVRWIIAEWSHARRSAILKVGRIEAIKKESAAMLSNAVQLGGPL